jgi:hypothetical protein
MIYIVRGLRTTYRKVSAMPPKEPRIEESCGGIAVYFWVD